MSNFQFVKNIYSWGIDIKPYVGSWITSDEYKQITGSDYVAEATASTAGMTTATTDSGTATTATTSKMTTN